MSMSGSKQDQKYNAIENIFSSKYVKKPGPPTGLFFVSEMWVPMVAGGSSLPTSDLTSSAAFG
jgi:hypothetical protein